MLLETGDALGGAKESPVVLVSLRPRSYSDAIGSALGQLMPHGAVRVVEPVHLEALARLLDPVVVLCSQPRAFPHGGGLPWIEYYPYAESPEEEIRVDGRGSGRRALDLSDLLALVDYARASA